MDARLNIIGTHEDQVSVKREARGGPTKTARFAASEEKKYIIALIESVGEHCVGEAGVSV